MRVKPSKAAPPILRNEALARIGGEEDFLEELLDLYRREFAAKRKAAEKAVRKADGPAVREVGHNLKGSSANLSLPGLREAALALEIAGQRADMIAAREALDKLDAEYARLEAFLR